MITPCRFVLDNGQPCGNLAQHFSHFCRHHSPEALRRRGPRTRPVVPADPNAQRAQLSLYWRRFHAHIAQAEAEALQDSIGQLLFALGERLISPCSAGRLFRAIEDRHRVLEAQSLLHNVLDCADSMQAEGIRNGGVASQVIEEQTLALRRCLQEMTIDSKQDA